MIIEYVILNSESTHWIPSKWAVINSTLTAVNTGFAWLKRISYGVETEQNLTDYIASYNNGGGNPDKSQLLGVLGEYKIVAMSTISEYKKNALKSEFMPISIYPIG